LGRWQPKLQVTADRIPVAKVHLGESLVDDRRLVPGSTVQFGERFAKDETARDGPKILRLHDHGHDVRGWIVRRPPVN
jgi:hypothetical protein